MTDPDEPDEDTLVKRVLGITGCSDKKTVTTMAKIIKAVSEYCRENLIATVERNFYIQKMMKRKDE